LWCGIIRLWHWGGDLHQDRLARLHARWHDDRDLAAVRVLHEHLLAGDNPRWDGHLQLHAHAASGDAEGVPRETTPAAKADTGGTRGRDLPFLAKVVGPCIRGIVELSEDG
jgi:hypothetical protein